MSHRCNWRCYDGYSHADPPPRYLKCGISECRLPDGHDGKHSDGTREWSNPNCVDCGCIRGDPHQAAGQAERLLAGRDG